MSIQERKSGRLFVSPVWNDQGMKDLSGTKTRQFFFSYVCNSKIIKELFAHTLNRITVRVRRVSSTAAVVNAELIDWLRREQKKKTTRNEETRRE